MEQPPFTNEVTAVVETERKAEILLHTLVGEYLASGLTNEEILTRLQEQELSIEKAQKILRGVYDSWSSVRVGLNLQSEDERNWHHYLRMRLLQTAIGDVSTPSQNLALRILDSLANLQGITRTQAQPVPLSIELIEKKPEPSQKQENTNG